MVAIYTSSSTTATDCCTSGTDEINFTATGNIEVFFKNETPIKIPLSIPDYEKEKKLWHETNRWYYNGLLKDMSDRFIQKTFTTILSNPKFHRKCHMQLKTGMNYRRKGE